MLFGDAGMVVCELLGWDVDMLFVASAVCTATASPPFRSVSVGRRAPALNGDRIGLGLSATPPRDRSEAMAMFGSKSRRSVSWRLRRCSSKFKSRDQRIKRSESDVAIKF
jgi:hypothetical protein